MGVAAVAAIAMASITEIITVMVIIANRGVASRDGQPTGPGGSAVPEHG